PRLAGAVLADGERLTVDGDRGLVYRGDQREADGAEPAALGVLRRWAAELGMDFAGEPAGAPAAGAATESIAPLALLRALQLRGFAGIEQLAASLLAAVAPVRAAMDALPAGLVATAPRGLHLTPGGRAWLAAALAEERRLVDPGEAAGCYEAFVGHDGAFKQVVTDWQMRPVDGTLRPNDHADPIYDEAVLHRFAELHAAVDPLLRRLVALVPRLRRYGDRLAAAAASVAAGDTSMIASPLRQSYHTVWFELHEELIDLAGRDRASEEQKQARP
ncbi:MAG TPA: hypothetical protein VMU42_11930, partial [Candidatus Sulfotelmatobacter sp.]|nr:hypothetical protein [Candidatus Sulfotelmatobacter sp.]